MTDPKTDLDEEHRQMTQGQQPGGHSNRGPAVNPGGDVDPQGLVPPYERDDSGSAKSDTKDASHKAFHADEHAPEPGEAPPISQEEREAPSPTDTTGATPLGVGESRTKGGEELAEEEDQPGRVDTGPQGESQRPSGTSTSRFSTGVDPQD